MKNADAKRRLCEARRVRGALRIVAADNALRMQEARGFMKQNKVISSPL
jgi:hypothetical protein